MSSTTSDSGVRYERLRALTLGRACALIAFTGLFGTFGRALVAEDGWPLLATVAAVYAAVQASMLFLAPRRDDVQRVAAEVTLVVDVVALAIVLTLTGGTTSPLAPLVVVEVVAVTLLFGPWAGSRAAIVATLAIAWVVATGPLSLGLAIGAVRRSDPAVAFALDPTVRGVLLLAVVWATLLITGWLSDVTARDLRRRTEDLTTLRDITPDLDPRQGPQRLAEVLAEVIVTRLGYPASAVWLRTEDRYVLTGTRGSRHHPSLEPVERDLADDPSTAALLATDGLHAVRRDDPRPPAMIDLFGRRTALAVVPLRVEGRTVGVVAVEVAPRLGRGPTLRVREVRLLRMLGEQAALLLENARLQAELADLAVTDAVTGLPNHRFLQQRLAEELERVARQASDGDRRALSLALFDLDHFKQVNDTYGHPTGDRVLAAVAAAANRTLRGSDVVCRYGGEEFAIVLVDTDAPSARLACERVRGAIKELALTSIDDRPLGAVTASFGIATVIGTSEDRSVLLERADSALYGAKRSGRDRVVHDEDLADVVAYDGSVSSSSP